MFLQAEGFQVSVAVNGQEALDLMARVRPSLALVDLNMFVVDSKDQAAIFSVWNVASISR